MVKNPFLSLVIPTYNEEKRIGPTLNKIIPYFKTKNYDYEIIIVDGSEDNTIGVVKKFKNPNIKIIKTKQKLGKGIKVKIGMLESNGNFIFFSDTDLSVPIEEIERFLTYFKAYDVVIASRCMPKSKIEIKQPFYRRLLGKIAKYPISFVISNKNQIKDTQCGFKGFTKKVANKLFKKQTINGGMFDVEILYLANKYGYKIKELPITWRDNHSSRINVMKCIFFDPIDLIKIKINNLRGLYK